MIACITGGGSINVPLIPQLFVSYVGVADGGQQQSARFQDCPCG